MELCEVCGTENREKAKFCRGCARALSPVAASAAATDTASNRALRCGVCQAIHSRDASICLACGHSLGAPTPDLAPEDDAPLRKARRWPWAVVLACVLVVVAMATWGVNDAGPVDVAVSSTATPLMAVPTAATVAEAPSTLNQPTPSAPELAGSPASMEAGMSAAEKAQLEALVAREAERTEKSRQTIARLAEQERAAKEARAAARAAAERQRAEAAERQAPTQIAAAAPNESKSSPVTAGNAAAPPPAANKSVEQACASATNFLSRDLCRIDACREPSNARDPICVWYKRIEEERKSRLSN